VVTSVLAFGAASSKDVDGFFVEDRLTATRFFGLRRGGVMK